MTVAAEDLARLSAAGLTVEDAVRFHEDLTVDPASYLLHVLGFRCWSAQAAIARSVAQPHSWTAVRSANSTGKTALSGRLADWFPIRYSPSIIITTAPTDRQVEGLLWQQLRDAHNNARLPIGGMLLNKELKLDDGWFAVGFTSKANDPNRFSGWHSAHMLVVLDEASGIPRGVRSAVEGLRAGGDVRVLEIGNPIDPTSPFRESFSRKGVTKFKLDAMSTPNFKAFGITFEDLCTDEWARKIDGRPLPWPNITSPRWAAGQIQDYGPDHAVEVIARIKAEFPDYSEDSLFTGFLLGHMFSRRLEPSAPHVLAIDVGASKSGDPSVAGLRRGGHFRIVSEWRDPDTMGTVGRIITLAQDHQPIDQIRIDNVGLGKGVLDRLREIDLRKGAVLGGMGPRIDVVGVQFGAGADDPEHFQNVRAESYGILRKLAQDNAIDLDPVDHELREELAWIREKPNSRGKLSLRPKEELPRSPNRADTAAIAFAEQLDGAGWYV